MSRRVYPEHANEFELKADFHHDWCELPVSVDSVLKAHELEREHREHDKHLALVQKGKADQNGNVRKKPISKKHQKHVQPLFWWNKRTGAIQEPVPIKPPSLEGCLALLFQRALRASGFYYVVVDHGRWVPRLGARTCRNRNNQYLRENVVA